MTKLIQITNHSIIIIKCKSVYILTNKQTTFSKVVSNNCQTCCLLDLLDLTLQKVVFGTTFSKVVYKGCYRMNAITTIPDPPVPPSDLDELYPPPPPPPVLAPPTPPI
jgi:hypothetical protein